MAQVLGGDLVGMSTTLEAIAARQSGLDVLGISLVTNPAAGISKTPLNHEEVLGPVARRRRTMRSTAGCGRGEDLMAVHGGPLGSRGSGEAVHPTVLGRLAPGADDPTRSPRPSSTRSSPPLTVATGRRRRTSPTG